MYLQRQMATIVAAVLATIIVIDGDTVEMDGKRYRLLGFDTPETYHARCGWERMLGYHATERLRALVSGTATVLVPTGKNCKFNRECANLYHNGENTADIMIREGHGVPYNGRGPRKNWCG